jgi:hypothetical protein
MGEPELFNLREFFRRKEELETFGSLGFLVFG